MDRRSAFAAAKAVYKEKVLVGRTMARPVVDVGPVGVGIAALAGLFATAAAAAEAPPSDIVVTAPPTGERVLPPQVRLDEADLVERQPRTVGEALRGLAGISVRTNSRGETIARVRGTEERQTQVFLDGAPLAVPWDGRSDIGTLPASLLAGIVVVKGAAPIEYGANAVGGIIDLRTRSGEEPAIRAGARIGSGELGEAWLVAAAPLGGISLTGAVAGLRRDSESTAGQPDLLGREGRTNTDLESGSAFASAQYRGGPVTARLLLLHSEAERGIAPETPRDPSLSDPRFWRYPRIALTQLILSSQADLAGGAALRLVGWRQWFGQSIDQYADARYERLSALEVDEDDTLGGRLTLSARVDRLTVRLSATGQTSRHAQVDTRPPAGPGPLLRYRQNLFSLGGEADLPLGGAKATFGIAYDRSEAPLTGDKPALAPLDALGFSAALRTGLGHGLALSLTAGRRTRFPTLRELFGEALGRFLPNPDLRPETAWLADAELSWSRPGLSVTINPFLSRNLDGLSQRVVTVDGRTRRQRFNLPGSWSLGLDARLEADIGGGLSLELDATALRARADGAPPRRLVQRPSWEMAAALRYAPSELFSARAELRAVGPAVDFTRTGTRTDLPAGAQLDLRASRQVAALGRAHHLHLVAAADNLLGGTITPQLGLPLPGRSLRIGFRID